MVKCKTAEQSDYQKMEAGAGMVNEALNHFQKRGIRVDIPHPARLWEYSSFVQFVMESGKNNDNLTYLDAGSGFSLLGPMMSWMYSWRVTEYDSPLYYSDKPPMKEMREALGMRFIDFTQELLPNEKFDVVSSVSVVEHLHASNILPMLRSLCERVGDGGLFFLTVDIVPDKSSWNATRNTEIDIPMWRDILFEVASMGFELQGGEPDLTYHGNFVHDYSMARACFVRTK